MRTLSKVLVALLLVVVGSQPLRSQESAGLVCRQADQPVIGFSPIGFGYDTYGRLLAKYLGKYLPGHPARHSAKSAGRRVAVAGQLHLQRWRQGRHRHRARRAWRRHGADAFRQRVRCKIRRDQVELDRQHEQRGCRLLHIRIRRRRRTSRTVLDGHGDSGRFDRKRRRSADLCQRAQRRLQDQPENRRRLSRHERDPAWDEPRRARRRAWLFLGRGADGQPRPAQGRQRSS